MKNSMLTKHGANKATTFRLVLMIVLYIYILTILVFLKIVLGDINMAGSYSYHHRTRIIFLTVYTD